MGFQMIDEFKDFWSRYKPYQLHPDDESAIYNSRKANKILENPELFFIKKDILSLNKTFLNDLKNPENNKIFQKSINPNAIHTNMYCRTFIGDIEKFRESLELVRLKLSYHNNLCNIELV